MNNARRHGERLDPAYGGVDPFSSAWHFDGWSHEGWKKHGAIGVSEVPKRARALYPTREEWLGMAE